METCWVVHDLSFSLIQESKIYLEMQKTKMNQYTLKGTFDDLQPPISRLFFYKTAAFNAELVQDFGQVYANRSVEQNEDKPIHTGTVELQQCIVEKKQIVLLFES